MPRATIDDGVAEIDGLVLVAPGVRGSVQVERGPAPIPVRRGAAAGVGPASRSLDRALRRQRMRTSKTAVIDGTRTVRRGATRPEPLTLRVRAPRRGREQVVLTIENGVATWHMSQQTRSAAAATDSGTRTYVIPQVQPPNTLATRGGFSVSTIIKVITFPVSRVVGEVAQFAARRWDLENHPPQVRAYGPDGRLTELSAADRASLSAGRTLLFVHGTFSTTEGAFDRLPAETMEELHRRYDGRVIAFDHPTIADDPFVNARQFYDIIGDLPLEMDIVCHSRGGLVARSIAERPGDLAALGPRTKVPQIVLVGVVNQGTILADADNWGELVDRFTSMLFRLTGPGIAQTLETVLAVVKSIAIGTVHELEGLSCMAPGSEFLQELNTGPSDPTAATYRAITSDFEPSDPGLKAWLNDEVRDRIFEALPNDMMVTIESMAGANGSARFPIEPTSTRTFAAADAIEHSDYFGQPLTSSAFDDWLKG